MRERESVCVCGRETESDRHTERGGGREWDGKVMAFMS